MLLKLILSLVFILIIFILYFAFEIKNLEVTNYVINTLFNLNKKIIVISDLHNFNYLNKKKNIYEIILKNKPDYILISGDLITYDQKDFSNTINLLENISKTNIPVIYSLGNHELKLEKYYPEKYKDYINTIKSFGVRILNNDYYIENNICFYGYTNRLNQYTKFSKLYELSMEEFKEDMNFNPDRNYYNILLAHNPVYFKQYSKWGADLVVSGHLHGGIIRLPFIGGILSPQTFFRKSYDAGKYTENHSTMLISRGLGVHTIPIRFNNRPELMMINLK